MKLFLSWLDYNKPFKIADQADHAEFNQSTTRKSKIVVKSKKIQKT